MKNTPIKYKKNPPIYWEMEVGDVRVVTHKEALAAHWWGLRREIKFSRDKRPHEGKYLITRMS